MSLDVVNLKRAFITYVRPLLEYASPVWSPSHIYLINEIESVQRSFTERLPGMRTLHILTALIGSNSKPSNIVA